MVIVMRGKSVRVSAEPEVDEEEKKTIDLVDKMRAELHKLNEKDEEDEDEDEEE